MIRDLDQDSVAIVDIPLTLGELEMNAQEHPHMDEFRANWEEAKESGPDWLEDWLNGQYIGECNAVASMEHLLELFGDRPEAGKPAMLVKRIVIDEQKHVEMIGTLLRSRGVQARKPDHTEVLRGMDQQGAGCAIASRAEAVRAGEIRIVLADPDVPGDVRAAFSEILLEESFHERAFRHLAGEDNMLLEAEFQGWCDGSGN